MLAIDEIRCVFLSQSPVELLHTFRCVSHVLRSYLDDPLVLGPLCGTHKLQPQSDFVSFLKVYNRKYMLIEEQQQWYVMSHLDDIPVRKALKRAARYRHYDTLRLILNHERLWCCREHISIVYIELYFNNTGDCESYLKDLREYDITNKSIDRVYGACEKECIKRGVYVDLKYTSNSDAQLFASKQRVTVNGNSLVDTV